MITVKKYENLPVDRSEIMRYMGCFAPDARIDSLICDCLGECGGLLSYKVCFEAFPVAFSENGVAFPFGEARSMSLKKHLDGCSCAVIFAATVGIGLDRLILKYSRLSASRALCFQAIGAERIEALCDAFCAELRDKFGDVSARFSPGYGDLPLEFQTEIFKALDCPRKIGLSLNSALLMSPSKSVTAIVGIK